MYIPVVFQIPIQYGNEILVSRAFSQTHPSEDEFNVTVSSQKYTNIHPKQSVRLLRPYERDLNEMFDNGYEDAEMWLCSMYFNKCLPGSVLKKVPA
jgi:hypothetical protein